MNTLDDLALLREYAAKKSEAAFETLVSRYINVVYSAALRQTGDPHQAEEITQAVFIILARKAGGMGEGTLLLGWLFRTVRFTASAQIRAATRRRRREQEALMECSTVETSPDSTWELISPLLDEALASLNAPDRQAVLLQYLEQKSLAEVGASLAVNEEAARKRVARALEKLRKFFTKRGVVLTATVIGGAMSAHAVRAAPAGLARAVAGTAIAHTAAGGSTLTLVKGALKIMAWTKVKIAVLGGLGVLLAAGTTTLVIKQVAATINAALYESIFEKPNEDAIITLKNAPPTLILRPTHYPDLRNGGGWAPGNNGALVATAGGGFWTPSGQIVFVNMPLTTLLNWIYGAPVGPDHFFGFGARMILPEGLTEQGYDFLSNDPAHQKEALQKELKGQLGLNLRDETRETDALRIQVKDAAKFAAHLTQGGQFLVETTGDRDGQKWLFMNVPISALETPLENIYQKPVVDRTGSQDHFDFTFKWHGKPWPNKVFTPQERKSLVVESKEYVRQLFDQDLDEVGLELVPGRETIEMVVVEREKN